MSTSTKKTDNADAPGESERSGGKHFIKQIIDEHIESGKWGPAGDRSVVKTRFPPEPNGYLHIGHAKSICLNFGLAEEYGGSCNLRFDDTNPLKEEETYVRSIIEDVKWLGFDWEGEPKFASDYFERMHELAVELIRKGLAYVDDQSAEEIRQRRGTLKEPGEESPCRERSVEENLDLFDRMTRGEFEAGQKVLRAKIDMASPNLNLRDPVMYRVLHARHHHTGETWHVYPMYDWAHGLEDSIEGITHSLCTLEFENHRPLYDWYIRSINALRLDERKRVDDQLFDYIDEWSSHLIGERGKLLSRGGRNQAKRFIMRVAGLLGSMRQDMLWQSTVDEIIKVTNSYEWVKTSKSRQNLRRYLRLFRRDWRRFPSGKIHHPRQIEFARLNFNYTIMSKRKLLRLVQEGFVDGWDDPRMPTLAGYRRRGYPPEAIRNLCADIGVSKYNATIDLVRLENAARDVLNKIAQRRMAVLDPIRVVITNYPKDEVEQMEAVNNPEDESAGTRTVPFSREIYIERDDFMEDPPKKFFRLGPGREVRLRSAYWITCTDVIKDEAGNITELHATYDPETRGGGNPPDGRKVKGTLHWVSANHAIDATVRLYDRLFNVEKPDKVEEGGDFTDNLNPDSLKTITGAKLEPSLVEAGEGDVVQFERIGYFAKDRDSTEDAPVFNRTVTLKDSWAKQAKK